MTSVAPRTVVLTRQPAQAGAVEAGLEAAGYPVAFLPLTDFELPADPSPLRACVARLGSARAGAPAWLVLTSPNTVRALTLSGWDGRVDPGTRIAVTGPGTARVLAETGCTETPWSPVDDASAAGIVAQFPAPDPAPDPVTRTMGTESDRRLVLLPQSSLATAEVEEGIAHLGWEVERVEAYRTVPYPAATGRRLLAPDRDPGSAGIAVPEHAPAQVTLQDLVGADVVLTSPSAVAELVRRRGTGVPEGTRFFAIGRPTQVTAEGHGLDLAGTAVSPDAEGLLALLAQSRLRPCLRRTCIRESEVRCSR